MRSSTKSLLATIVTVAAITVTPLVLDSTGGSAPNSPAAVDSAISGTSSPASPDVVRAVIDEPVQQPGSSMGGDLPPESLPAPAYPQCPITPAGTWWTDPADPYTCLPPQPAFQDGGPFHEPTPPGIDPELLKPIAEEPREFHEPTPPGIDPELLKPIVEEPAPVEPTPGADCRSTGALQCTVTIMGQNYVVTFADGKPVGVAEAR